MELGQVVALIVILLFFAALVQARRNRRRGHGRGPGAGATGAIYDMLMEDKRKAIEIILEERAEERDPETADGDLPALESPKRK
jgi:hypothetical protein